MRKSDAFNESRQPASAQRQECISASLVLPGGAARQAPPVWKARREV
jgi:hypothetical protein